MTYDKQNIFAQILRGEIPHKKVHETEHALAFYDIAPQAPIHVLVMPKAEYVSAYDFADAPAELQRAFWQAVKETAEALGVVETGYRLLANVGKNAGQMVEHFHMHILAGEPLGGLRG